MGVLASGGCRGTTPDLYRTLLLRGRFEDVIGEVSFVTAGGVDIDWDCVTSEGNDGSGAEGSVVVVVVEEEEEAAVGGGGGRRRGAENELEGSEGRAGVGKGSTREL